MTGYLSDYTVVELGSNTRNVFDLSTLQAKTGSKSLRTKDVGSGTSGAELLIDESVTAADIDWRVWHYHWTSGAYYQSQIFRYVDSTNFYGVLFVRKAATTETITIFKCVAGVYSTELAAADYTVVGSDSTWWMCRIRARTYNGRIYFELDKSPDGATFTNLISLSFVENAALTTGHFGYGTGLLAGGTYSVSTGGYLDDEIIYKLG